MRVTNDPAACQPAVSTHVALHVFHPEMTNKELLPFLRPLKFHLYPNLHHADRGQPFHGSRVWWLSEKWDVKKDEKARHSEIKPLSQNHRAKQILAVVRDIFWMHSDFAWPSLLIKPQDARVGMNLIRSVP